jgi:hypothetical protein
MMISIVPWLRRAVAARAVKRWLDAASVVPAK